MFFYVHLLCILLNIVCFTYLEEDGEKSSETSVSKTKCDPQNHKRSLFECRLDGFPTHILFTSCRRVWLEENQQFRIQYSNNCSLFSRNKKALLLEVLYLLEELVVCFDNQREPMQSWRCISMLAQDTAMQTYFLK